MSSEYVQYGCGWSSHDAWKNFDASPTLRLERLPFVGKYVQKNARRFPDAVEYGDIVAGLPVPNGSCTGVYCSHVLEHLSLVDFRTALRNTYRILKPGGVFRMVMPDLEWAAKQYLNDPSPGASFAFMNETVLGRRERPRGLKGLVISFLGNSEHQWMWDYKALESELKDAGFANIRRAVVGDSVDPKFCEVEEPGRWENCLGAECIRPR